MSKPSPSLIHALMAALLAELDRGAREHEELKYVIDLMREYPALRAAEVLDLLEEARCADE